MTDTRRAGYCVRCGVQRDVHPEHGDASCPRGYLEPDFRSDAEIEREAQLARHELLKRRQVDKIIAPIKPATGFEVVAPLRERDVALAGTIHVDYFPRDTCAICGGVPWFNGRRIVDEHDASKHNLTDDTQLDSPSARKYAQQKRGGDPTRVSIDAQARVRRTYGERDDD